MRLGVISTPGVAYLTKEMDAELGVMISASHNPVADNGIKFLDQMDLNYLTIKKMKLKHYWMKQILTYLVQWVMKLYITLTTLKVLKNI